ncbi:ECF RNA polymerase sigma factor SigW [Clostridiaceae bacterium BL-3]|nr:sigma-70 family RNA polymerase sigma factor [Clostridium sp. HV4-5-A1G]CAB1246361.1 ECF RNA polymerase sigma factor SigW [Clostridiaceae bacterium BL-3]
MIIQENQFEKYIKQYEGLVITICFSFTKNYFDAEDIAQQTFLTAYEKLNKFDGKNFKAWVAKIAVNKCRDYIKSPVKKMEDLTCEDYKYIEDTKSSPEENMLNNYSDRKIYKLCSRLKEPYKTVAVNYFCKDIKLSDMAKDTGENLKTLQTRLYRSKKLLKILWKEELI